MPLDGEDGIFVAVKLLYLLFNLSNVVEFNFVITSTREEVGSINWIPFNLLDRLTMSFKLEKWLMVSVSWIPDYNVFIFTSSNN